MKFNKLHNFKTCPDSTGSSKFHNLKYMLSRPNVITIAGFDPSAGAGILADIKTFENHKVYGFAVNTANTWQNDIEFTGLSAVEISDIIKQIELQYNRFEINFAKIGLVTSLLDVNKIVNYLIKRNPKITIIWDPIISATAGFNFIKDIDRKELQEILSKIYLITPNIDEAKILFKNNISIEHLLELSSRTNYPNILLKGGHAKSTEAKDILFENGIKYEFKTQMLSGYSKHGTGCVLSAAITANLANGFILNEACEKAKKYVYNFIKSNETRLGYHNISKNI